MRTAAGAKSSHSPHSNSARAKYWARALKVNVSRRLDLLRCSLRNLVNQRRPISRRSSTPNSDLSSRLMLAELLKSSCAKCFINSLTGSSPARQSRLMDEAHEGTEFCDSERIKLRQSLDSMLGLACSWSGSSRRLVRVLLFEVRLRGGTRTEFTAPHSCRPRATPPPPTAAPAPPTASVGGCTSICGGVAVASSSSLIRCISFCMSSSLRLAPAICLARS